MKDFINKYGQLSDSIINEINFVKLFENEKEINIIRLKIYCCNIANDYRYETIELYFKNIISLSPPLARASCSCA